MTHLCFYLGLSSPESGPYVSLSLGCFELPDMPCRHIIRLVKGMANGSSLSGKLAGVSCISCLSCLASVYIAPLREGNFISSRIPQRKQSEIEIANKGQMFSLISNHMSFDFGMVSC